MANNLIIGAGAIGTVFAGYLTAARRPLRAVFLSSRCVIASSHFASYSSVATLSNSLNLLELAFENI